AVTCLPPPVAGGVSQPPATGGGKQVTAYVNGRPSNITVQPVGNGQYMRADAARNFKAMQAAAAQAGVNLSATSGFRTMAQQQALYQKYLNGTGNLAAKPGYSNHQNGISMDVGGIGGYNTKAYNWLKNNASKYGFQNDVRGEFWHWTFKG
ncbi:MAG TPA: D-alanyl-D-alanine carboxypeptidase family protein, partial [Hyalangium sp.]|nr:D-alanyl-D-alanine carboxypeptidase family protein [Hyalangium sp.]